MILLYLIAQASSIEAQVATSLSESPILSSLASSASKALVPAVASAINFVLPAVMKQITRFEKWGDAGRTVKFMVTRLFFAKTLNAFIQVSAAAAPRSLAFMCGSSSAGCIFQSAPLNFREM